MADSRSSHLQAEVLYESDRTRVSRLSPADGGPTVIRKEPLGQGAPQRLLHEREILERLTGVTGVPQLATAAGWPGSLVIEDVHGEALSRSSAPMEGSELTRLALDLALALYGMHGRGVVHRNICPANVVLAASGSPVLIDFAEATTHQDRRSGSAHQGAPVGTLAYLAPEQTGRTEGLIDRRTDFYALGATLYGLAAGAPPFGVGDPLRVSHDHLAQAPTPPTVVNPAVPPELSDIIMHLLEKEPDRRYQTAEGLAYDLLQLSNGRPVRVGERDFPIRLLPSRVIGRGSEITALGAAFAAALAGRRHAILVSGALGVGKTSLISELRSIVTASNGWFVVGKFDQHRQNEQFDAVRQAFRALGQRLLADPEGELAEIRARIRQAVGPNAGLLAAVLPEFGLLLGVPPDPTISDPLKERARASRLGLDLLRAIASPKRPVVIVFDDLQWADQTPLAFIDAVISADESEGVLLVAAYRHDEIPTTHPLATMLSRWRRLRIPPEELYLHNLPSTSLATLLVDMLRINITDAGSLAGVIGHYTHGNPYDTIEVVNSLKRESILRLGPDGWCWDLPSVRRHLTRATVAQFLVDRLAALPRESQDLLEVAVCIGGQVDLNLLQSGTGLPFTQMMRRLRPALDDGLLVPGSDGEASVRFPHDKVREAVQRRLTPQQEYALRLGLGRRLAPRPEFAAIAAQQYLRVVDAIRGDGDEARRVVDLFRRAATQALPLGNYQVAEAFLTAALKLMSPSDNVARIDVETGRHAALYSLGRLEEADDAYRTIGRLSQEPLQRADATLVQVSSLTHRGLAQEALTLGLDLLRQFGVNVPTADQLPDEIERGLTALYRWVEDGDADTDLRRQETTDRLPMAVAALIHRLMATSFIGDQRVLTWLALEAMRLWATRGPSRVLVRPASLIGFVVAMLRHDYRTAQKAVRRILAFSEARGYEPETAYVQYCYAHSAGHWFEPLEDNVALGMRAREGLVQGGDLQYACYTYYVSVQQLIDFAPSLEGYLGEVESALSFAARTGNAYAAGIFEAYRRMTLTLRGAAPAPQAESSITPLIDDPLIVARVHITRALTAAILDDTPRMIEHVAAAMPLLANSEATYSTAHAYLLHGLGLTRRIQNAASPERSALLAELDTVLDWLAARAEDAPDNFLHLLRLVEAERAWACRDFRRAAYVFDVAQREATARHRPWHRALIFERSARFHLAHGMEDTGRLLLAQARQAYSAWGATAKVTLIDNEYPSLLQDLPSSGDASTPSMNIMTESLEQLGVLSAVQALSSEVSISGLMARVIELLTTMTGATAARLVLRGESDGSRLYPPVREARVDGGAIFDGGTDLDVSAHRSVPLSAVRYVERTRAPLVVTDAARDDRFARDPYFAELDCCSLLVVPIINRGATRAVLVLENRLIRGAFSAERVHGVMLVAGHVAVTIDNALLYESLERKVAERTRALAELNKRLELLSVTDSLTGLANRRKLEEVLAAEWREALLTSGPIAFALVDIDHFKLYNDHFGHRAGDECLRRVARVIQDGVRAVDLAARYGGEEFAIVMPSADIAEARQLAEAVATAVTRHAVPVRDDPARVITVSVGVAATTPSQGGSPGLIIEQADAALYRAKRAGRNQVMATTVT